MVLEWMRNGDYDSSRFQAQAQAQADAINLICGAKTQSNPENTVDILTMAAKGVRALVTPTNVSWHLPGVDPNDPSVKDLLASMQLENHEKKKEDDGPNAENK